MPKTRHGPLIAFVKHRPHPVQAAKAKVFIASPDDAREAFVAAREAAADAATERKVRYWFHLSELRNLIASGRLDLSHENPHE